MNNSYRLGIKVSKASTIFINLCDSRELLVSGFNNLDNKSDNGVFNIYEGVVITIVDNNLNILLDKKVNKYLSYEIYNNDILYYSGYKDKYVIHIKDIKEPRKVTISFER